MSNYNFNSQYTQPQYPASYPNNYPNNNPVYPTPQPQYGDFKTKYPPPPIDSTAQSQYADMKPHYPPPPPQPLDSTPQSQYADMKPQYPPPPPQDHCAHVHPNYANPPPQPQYQNNFPQYPQYQQYPNTQYQYQAPPLPQNNAPKFHTLKFLTNVTSFVNHTIYCFRTIESRERYVRYKGKNINICDDGMFSGLPLFSCEMKVDSSYLLTSKSTNYTIYKYIIIPSDPNHPDKKKLEAKYLHDPKKYKLHMESKEYAMTVYKWIYCEVVNKVQYMSLKKSRNTHLYFENESLIMNFFSFHDYISVSGHPDFEKNDWIFRNNEGNVFIDNIYINDTYKLRNDVGQIAAEIDNSSRSNKFITTTLREKLGDLIIPWVNNPEHVQINGHVYNLTNNYLPKFQEEILCMTFVIFYFIRREEKKRNDRIS